ncbi:hypothetical protein AB3464_04690 [Pseudomonas asplenii]|uniref:hypothetical protein n=1 Tax=Pseudomonas asplenii TaxID=53407 RepID=UPI0037C9D0E4
MDPTLHKAANGHLSLDFNEWPDTCWLSLEEELITRRGFKRVGSSVIGIDEEIHPGFHCAEFSLSAGWNHWSGRYLLSESVAGDIFLQGLFDQLCA